MKKSVKIGILVMCCILFCFTFLGFIGMMITPSEDSQDETASKVQYIEKTYANNIPDYQGSWRYVDEFDGASDKTTDTFIITGKKVRLTYEIDPENDYSIFFLYLYEEEDSFLTSMYSLKEGAETSISYCGSGTYYLNIGAANLDGWEVKVEEYY